MHPAEIVLALTGGLVPALFWLWFLLREDRVHPEPRSLVAASFAAGMVVVLLVLPLQQYALDRFSGNDLVLSWVIIEEVLKYAAALLVVLWSKQVDEPIDAIIYMIAIALGFSALENALFIFNPLSAGNGAEAVLTGNFRFVGASLLHVLASGTVGVAMAFAFYKGTFLRVAYATVGLCIAIVLHALFNFSIMNAHGETLLSIFMFVWLGMIVLFLIFEKIKRIRQPKTS
jgi:RsiW-degrading membrane proteinase PrsW (M82 family)